MFKSKERKKSIEEVLGDELLSVTNKDDLVRKRIAEFMGILWREKKTLRARTLCELPLYPSFRHRLAEEYFLVRDQRNRQHFQSIEKTVFERGFRTALYRVTPIKTYTSAWIGPYCCDLFLPQFGSERPGTRGIVIEIDGGIHHVEGKGGKDNKKRAFLEHLNLAVTSIENQTLNEPWLHNFIQQLAQTPRLSSAQRWKVLQTTRLATILCNRTPEELFKLLFPEKDSEVLSEGAI